jgi:hypothetical protein
MYFCFDLNRNIFEHLIYYYRRRGYSYEHGNVKESTSMELCVVLDVVKVHTNGEDVEVQPHHLSNSRMYIHRYKKAMMADLTHFSGSFSGDNNSPAPISMPMVLSKD